MNVKTNDFFRYSKTAFKKVIPTLIAICGLLVVSDVMVKTKIMSLLATSLSNVAGSLYPAIAVCIGSLGSFITGTNLGSNIMFSPMHIEASKTLLLNPVTIFAGQNAGGSLGNMICPNNIIAVATTVGILGKEGILLRKVLPAFLILLLVYGLTALIYTHILFTNFNF